MPRPIFSTDEHLWPTWEQLYVWGVRIGKPRWSVYKAAYFWFRAQYEQLDVKHQDAWRVWAGMPE